MATRSLTRKGGAGRAVAEILAAHRLDAIRVTLRGIATKGTYQGVDKTSSERIRTALRKIAKRLRVPFLPLLEAVTDEIDAADLPDLPALQWPAVERPAIYATRSTAGVETLAVFFTEVEKAYDLDVFSSTDRQEAIANQMAVPMLVVELLAHYSLTLEHIEAFNTWRIVQPAAAELLAREVG